MCSYRWLTSTIRSPVYVIFFAFSVPSFQTTQLPSSRRIVRLAYEQLSPHSDSTYRYFPVTFIPQQQHLSIVGKYMMHSTLCRFC